MSPTDRLNPILVKEVRAALRGRYFRVLFPLTLSVATAVGVLVLIDRLNTGNAYTGRDFFWAIYVCLLIALNGLVPFSAFVNMGSEWDEHTFDLLVISNLKPREIVLGKLLSAGVETLLYFSAFAPFLVFSFLLRGVGLDVIFILLGGSLITSISLSSLALALSSLARQRVVRVVMMAALAALLIASIVLASAFANSYLHSSIRFGSSHPTAVVLITYFALGAPGMLGFAIACERLAHAEENHSSPQRVLVTALLVVALGCTAWYGSRWPRPEELIEVCVAAAFAVAVFDVLFVTERERLTRRVRLDVPRRRMLARLAAPFLPGGGRGMLLFLFHQAMIFGVAATLILTRDPSTGSSARAGWLLWALSLFTAYLVVYVGLPALAFTRGSDSERRLVIARLSIPVIAISSMLLPSLFGFLAGSRHWAAMEHAFNPFWLAGERAWNGHADEILVQIIVLLLASLVVILNMPRMLAGVSEVMRASDERARSRVVPIASKAEEQRVASGL